MEHANNQYVKYKKFKSQLQNDCGNINTINCYNIIKFLSTTMKEHDKIINQINVDANAFLNNILEEKKQYNINDFINIKQTLEKSCIKNEDVNMLNKIKLFHKKKQNYDDMFSNIFRENIDLEYELIEFFHSVGDEMKISCNKNKCVEYVKKNISISNESIKYFNNSNIISNIMKKYNFIKIENNTVKIKCDEAKQNNLF
jgi:hypothetical protein